MDKEINTSQLDCLCKRCGRRLRSKAAILEGYGRVCKRKAAMEAEFLQLQIDDPCLLSTPGESHAEA